MKIKASDRGFRFLMHMQYPEPLEGRLLSESSVIGDYDDALDNPGSSALWVGDEFHLNREEVAFMVSAMQHWLDSKRLPAS